MLTTQKQKGFTLIEMMVALFIFSLVVVTAIGVLIISIDANGNVRGLKSAINNGHLALELMVRDLRFGSDFSCNGVGNCSGGADNMSVVNSSGDTIVYALVNESIYKTINTDPAFAITASDVIVNDLTFFVSGVGVEGNSDFVSQVQPYVAISLNVGVEETSRESVDIQLQTGVSQYCLDDGTCGIGVSAI
jgi:prepilin-type N-terminal cleavage/methylation domain-containing protein